MVKATKNIKNIVVNVLLRYLLFCSNKYLYCVPIKERLFILKTNQINTKKETEELKLVEKK